MYKWHTGGVLGGECYSRWDHKHAVYNQEIIDSGQIRCSILALSKYFDTLRKHKIHVARNI